MRIFVAGASGAVGRLLVPLLVAGGHQVTALSRRGGNSPGWVAGDVYDRDGLHELVAAARPEVVIHQLTDLGTRDFAANSRIRREGTRNLVDAALAAGVRRVVAQSIAWAYEPGSTPADESTPLDVRSTDEARRATVDAVATLETITAEAPEWVALRYGLLYGPGTWYTKGGLMATTPLPTGPDITSFLHVEDAAQAALEALTWPSGPLNIVDNHPLPASTWAPAFADSVGAPAPAPPGPSPTPAPPGPSPVPAPSGGSAVPALSGGSASAAPGGSTRTPWARGGSNARARSLGWAPAHPHFLDALT
ncbi:NAD-dependent epimerase/dehydratase family protein [Kribbella sp. WER1]